MASAAIAKLTYSANAPLPRPSNSPKFAAISFAPRPTGFRPSPPSFVLNRSANGSSLPVIRAQGSTDYVPEANFYKVEAILRPWRIPQVSSALLKMGIRGVTVSDVRGFGAQGGSPERQAGIVHIIQLDSVIVFSPQKCLEFIPASNIFLSSGSEFSEDNFVVKVKMEIVVSKHQVEEVIDKIIHEARTGEIGDGKIFLTPVADIIRVRTGERGEKAERMVGGHADMSSARPSA
ncbi:Nitrogen regulatory protein P-II homolog [Striga hermonthica]|uniref:Nitrogen regulatory protein P-II homolog n=1 Tax=Striga hermonthica TaxID=68872 RepID=A0A9N7N1U6_STRHE|nr:Nitrogen regulatory protein P-II homolog [Striga hermonthica]